VEGCGPTLVEQHSLVDVRIEKPSLTNGAARAWTAMQEKRRLARGIAATFPVDPVAIPHIQQSVLVWLDRLELSHRLLLSCA
jgi:hypothetical protein